MHACRSTLEDPTKAAALAPENIRYFDPGGPPLIVDRLPNLRIYVLGPPRDQKLLRVTERAGEMYGLGSLPLAEALAGSFRAAAAGDTDLDPCTPFDPLVGYDLSGALAWAEKPGPKGRLTPIAAFTAQNYSGPAKPEEGRLIRSRPRKKVDANERDQSWRRIDHDWLGAGDELALQLTSGVNNTSLALAFEFVDSGRVLLFPADAEVGSWLSWQDLAWTIEGKSVSVRDLLARTVYYKVSHHGSENGTLKAKGLEMMTSRDLSAFIPTNEVDAEKVGWGEMPFGKILDALHERCGNRVFRADDAWVRTDKRPASLEPSGSIKDIRHEKELFVEFDVA